jgi:hypothetical protein
MRPNHLPRRTVLTTIATLASATLVSSNAAAHGANEPGRSGRCVGVNRRTVAPRGGPANRPGASSAVVDRIVDGRFVVLLLEEEGATVDQLVVTREELPAVDEGDVLLVVVEEGTLREARPLAGETRRRRRWSEGDERQMERLFARMGWCGRSGGTGRIVGSGRSGRQSGGRESITSRRIGDPILDRDGLERSYIEEYDGLGTGAFENDSYRKFVEVWDGLEHV